MLQKIAKILCMVTLLSFLGGPVWAQIQVKPNVPKDTPTSSGSTTTPPVELTVNDVAGDVSTDGSFSLSDLAIEQLTSVKGTGIRNPFLPGVVEEEFDPTSLIVQGIVIGPDLKY